MRIPKKIRAMEWPKPWEGNATQDFKLEVYQPVVGGERLMVLTFLWNRNPEKKFTESRTDFRLVLSKKLPGAAELCRGETRGQRRTLNKMDVVRWQYPEIEPQQEAALGRWLGKTESGNHFLPELIEWVGNAIADENQREADARGELRDEDVGLCPKELPEGLERFIRNTVLPQDNTLIYKKGNVRGTCHVCGRKVRARLQRFKQYECVHCPDCGAAVVCYLETSDAFKVDRVQNVATIQRGTDGKTLFVRQWSLMRDEDAQYDDLGQWLNETARYAVRGNKAAKWQREFKYRDGWSSMHPSRRGYYGHWHRAGNPASVYDGTYAFFLPPDWQDICEGTSLQYCDLQGYIVGERECRYKNPIRYLMDFGRYPAIEKFWNAGYYKLVNQRVECGDSAYTIRWHKDSIRESLRFPMRLLKFHAPAEWTMERIQRVRELWEVGTLTDAEIARAEGETWSVAELKTALQHSSLHKVLRYYDTLKNKHDYRDYLKECEMLHLNLDDSHVLFPRDLETAHAETTAKVRYEAVKEKEVAFRKAVQKYRDYCWEQDGLLIRIPENGQELIREGQILKHCVGGYMERVAVGQTMIFLIRRTEEPDTPYYTLEWKNGKVEQCMTTGNRSYTQNIEVFQWVIHWIEHIKGLSKPGKKAATRAA